MRTKNVLRNLIISTFLTTAVALIGMIKIKYFLNYLGDEATGIYQVFTQIFSYISLVDAGLTSSILYSLYKPISNNDTKKINAILKGGRNFYNMIALVMIVIGILLSFKIDFFLSDYTLPFGYIQVCFIIFIVSSAIGYLVTTRKVIIEAKQNLYKVHTVVYLAIIIKGITEIFLLKFGYKLLTLIIVDLIISIIQNLVIIWVSKREYKDLSYKNIKPDNSFRKETKNLIVQKIGTLIFNNIDVLLISKFINATSVVIYTSYAYITNSLQNIVKKLGSSSLASVGNLTVTDKEKTRSVFREYNAMCFYIANLVCIPLLIAITPFVRIYYGETYTLPFIGSLCVTIILYLRVIEIPLDVYTQALGYFDKVKKCVILQSVVNLSLSIILLFKMGISGVLLATVISYLTGEFIIYPYILNKHYFKKDRVPYYLDSVKLLIIGIISYLITNYICTFLS